MNVAEALAAGIEEAQKRPHHKGEFLNHIDGQGVCMLGAVQAGVGMPLKVHEGLMFFDDGSEEQQKVFTAAWTALDRHAKARRVKSVPTFNDDPATSKEDVILFMKEALHELENNAD